MAFTEGRDYCTPEDFKPLAVPVFAHRVVVNPLYSSTLRKSEQSEQVLREIVDSVAVRFRLWALASCLLGPSLAP